jgi:hypothetical protein
MRRDTAVLRFVSKVCHTSPILSPLRISGDEASLAQDVRCCCFATRGRGLSFSPILLTTDPPPPTTHTHTPYSSLHDATCRYLDLNHVDIEHNSMSSPCIVPWKDRLPGERDIYERAHPRAAKYAQKTAATVARAALRASSKSRGSPAVASRRVAAVPSVRTARFASATPPATLAQVEAGEGLDPSVTLLLVAIALLIASSLCLWVCLRLTGPNAREDKRVS